MSLMSGFQEKASNNASYVGMVIALSVAMTAAGYLISDKKETSIAREPTFIKNPSTDTIDPTKRADYIEVLKRTYEGYPLHEEGFETYFTADRTPD